MIYFLSFKIFISLFIHHSFFFREVVVDGIIIIGR